jgi:hypothetical protein
MSTAFAAITTAIIAALGHEPVLSANIFRARDRQISEQHEDAITVVFDAAEPFPGVIHGAPVDWRSSYFVECYARSAVTTGDLAVDPLFARVYERLAQDPTLGGLVDDIGAPRIVAEYDALGQKTGWVRLTYSILHRTDNDTLN